MALVRIDWNPTPSALRRFGWSLAATALAVAILFWVFASSPKIPLILSAVFLCAGLACWVLPSAVARPVYLALMGPSFLVGNLMSRLLLAVVYALVVTPTGLLLRLAGKDPLGTRGDRPSMFVRLSDPPTPDRRGYERLS